MEFHTFDDWTKDAAVDALVFTNDRLTTSDKGLYGLLGVPKLFFENGTDIPTASPYRSITTGLNYPKTLDFSVPTMVLYKIVLFQPRDRPSVIQCLYEPGNPFVEAVKGQRMTVAGFLEGLLVKCESEFQKLHRITLEIKKKATYIDFFEAYRLIEYTDILLSHTLNYTLFLQDVQAFTIHTSVDKGSFENTYKTFQESVKLLNGILEQTRHGVMQRIAYLDSGTARILTIVATIFLPTAFLVSLMSMPLNGAPLRGRKNAYWVFVWILMGIFILLVAFFHRDFLALFRDA